MIDLSINIAAVKGRGGGCYYLVVLTTKYVKPHDQGLIKGSKDIQINIHYNDLSSFHTDWLNRCTSNLWDPSKDNGIKNVDVSTT